MDYALLKKSVSVHQVAQMLNLRQHHMVGGWHRAACPRCDFGTSKSLILLCERNLFVCATAGIIGDQIALVSHAKNVRPYAAAQQIAVHYSLRHVLEQPREKHAPESQKPRNSAQA